MKKKAGVVGYGNWAKKIIPIIDEVCEIKFIANTKISYKKPKYKVDWVFILTNNKSHYKIAKYFLEKKINVFCEKPLTENYTQSKKLISIASKKKCKIFISEVELFKNKKIPTFIRFKIERKKFEIFKKKNSSILFRLTYHDIYLLHQKLKNEKIKEISYKETPKILRLNILGERNKYNFNYNLASKKRVHFINNINLLSFSGNPLKKMIMKVLQKKVNFKKNNERALFCNYLIDKIKNYEITHRS
jgi:hypothetical protein